MSHDDTQQPFSPGYCASEPYPLNAADRIAAKERRIDELSASLVQHRDALDACRQRLRSLPNCGDLIAVVDRLLYFVEQRNTGPAAPIQGGH